MKHFKTLNILFISLLFIACSGSSEGSDNNDEEEDEVVELSDFGKMLRENFTESEVPYQCNTTFDSFEPGTYLNEEDFRMLELYMIFPDYEDNRYTAEHFITLENGLTLAIVTSEDNSQEISTYVITYDQDEYYVSNLRIGYEFTLLDMKISAVIKKDRIERTILEIHDGVEVPVEETYYIRADGSIDWEKDILGDDVL